MNNITIGAFCRLLATRVCAPAVMALLLVSTSMNGFAHQEEAVPVARTRVLGKIDFPTSARSDEAQQAFIRGMLLLHLFEYPFARQEFLRAQQLEPAFVMAYWGEAMTFNHPIWDQQDAAGGRSALAKLAASNPQRLALTTDPKEQAFLDAVDTLYGQGSKAARDQAYARAMERMAARFPDDHEVQLFYALALFGVQAGVRDIPTYMLCTAIAQNVFSANPQHPGAAHYLIHGVDDPDHAILGLAAARALARMAPDAGHSLHMTSHIFTALGMWDDVVEANEAAIRVQGQMRTEQGLGPNSWGHYNFWLLYGYLQQGRVQQARALLGEALQQLQTAHAEPEDPMLLDPDDSMLGSVVQMWARYLIETQDWDSDIARLSFQLGGAFDPNLNFSFVQGMRAAAGGQVEQADRYLDQFRQLRFTLEASLRAQQESAPTDLLYLQRLEVLESELQAALAHAREDLPAAIEHARQASDKEGEMPYAFGPPFVDWPAAELLGQLLLQAHSYEQAAAAFGMQLRRARQRSSALLGLARSERGLGHADEARYAAEKLQAIWHGADPEVRARLD